MERVPNSGSCVCKLYNISIPNTWLLKITSHLVISNLKLIDIIDTNTWYLVRWTQKIQNQHLICLIRWIGLYWIMIKGWPTFADAHLCTSVHFQINDGSWWSLFHYLSLFCVHEENWSATRPAFTVNSYRLTGCRSYWWERPVRYLTYCEQIVGLNYLIRDKGDTLLWFGYEKWQWRRRSKRI